MLIPIKAKIFGITSHLLCPTSPPPLPHLGGNFLRRTGERYIQPGRVPPLCPSFRATSKRGRATQSGSHIHSQLQKSCSLVRSRGLELCCRRILSAGGRLWGKYWRPFVSAGARFPPRTPRLLPARPNTCLCRVKCLFTSLCRSSFISRTMLSCLHGH